MRSLCRLSLLLGLIALAHRPVAACLWDRDTLAMERERFPDAIELITGKFLRHSRYYYEWRVKECEAIIATGEFGAPVLDDLAVAYEKLGNHDKAIETILKKEELFPGLYETYANLGTFYIHAGEFVKGVEQIDRAIEINPDAHFGREVYQRLLVQYVLSKRSDGKLELPLDKSPRRGFAAFVLKQKNFTAYGPEGEEELEKGRKGVMGMMRFGNFDSPVLLEALADLLLLGNESNTDDAKRLAACALLKASYEAENEATRLDYREKARSALEFQTQGLDSEDQLDLDELETVFKKQLAEANDWYGELESDEIGWIEAGENPDEEFAKKYNEEPRLSTTFDGPKMSRFQEILEDYDVKRWVPMFFAALFLGVIVFFFVKTLRKFAGPE